MKKILILVLCLLGWMTKGDAQNFVADFLANQTDPDIFTQVNISAKMFELVAPMADEELEEIVSNLSGMSIITTGRDPEGYFKQAKLILTKPSSGYESLMNVKEGREEVEMYIREIKGEIVELVILVGEGNEVILMNFRGKIDLKKISRLTQSVNINGIEYLNKVKDCPREKGS